MYGISKLDLSNDNSVSEDSSISISKSQEYKQAIKAMVREHHFHHKKPREEPKWGTLVLVEDIYQLILYA